VNGTGSLDRPLECMIICTSLGCFSGSASAGWYGGTWHTIWVCRQHSATVSGLSRFIVNRRV